MLLALRPAPHGAEQNDEHRQHGLQPAPPGVQLLCAIQIEFVSVAILLCKFPQPVQMVCSGCSDRGNPVLQDAAQQLSQAQLRFVGDAAGRFPARVKVKVRVRVRVKRSVSVGGGRLYAD